MKATVSSSSVLGAMCVLVSVAMSTGFASEFASKLLMDFSDASAASQWISVNDSVMGGLSEGGFRLTDNKTLVFYGSISLENRGGFASIRTRPSDLNLDGYDTIALRVRGDGRMYYFNLRTSSYRTAGSYRAPLKTQEGAWQEVRIPLTDFGYSAFGRPVTGVDPLMANRIQSVGFTLADKQAGPFRLEVDWINAEKATTPVERTAAKSPADSSGDRDIMETAVAAGQFKTLVAAVQTAGLVEALKGEGPLTVFAPSDDAFAKLPSGTVEELLQPENRGKLKAVLSYHVVPGRILLGTQSPQTLHGQSLIIRTAGSFKVNGANVMVADIAASNGVIHIIDSVLIPPATKGTPREAAKAVIELAIRRGVPLFNAGQPSACTAIYEVAIESLLKSHTSAIGDEDRSLLRNALREMRGNKEDPRQQAWTLRRALDAVYESLAKD
ncbi:MAG: CIA30 family protein [Phycisphaerales bacterium]|nr:MAG: CIA30 family protein [Phycisphaerales bacterium]